jgi:hypothetical protein
MQQTGERLRNSGRLISGCKREGLEEPAPPMSRPCCNLQPENFPDIGQELSSRVSMYITDRIIHKPIQDARLETGSQSD